MRSGARDKRIGRDVAVKVLPESFAHGDEELWRFEQEAGAAGGLNHPGLVTIFDVGTTGSSPYIVMELLEGETLRDAIDKAVSVSAPVPLQVPGNGQVGVNSDDRITRVRSGVITKASRGV